MIKALRGAPEIERIVYVSCNHVAWVEQARTLCCPGDGEDSRTPGEPFRPVRDRERERVCVCVKFNSRFGGGEFEILISQRSGIFFVRYDMA